MNRYMTAILLAFVVTAGLFLSMRYLIVGGEGAKTDAPEGRVIDFVRLKKEENTQTKKRKPVKPPKPEEQPPPMEQPPMQADDLVSGTTDIGFKADLSVDTGLSAGLALESGDGDYLPIVKVAPIYPRRALSRGIEGYVIVEFIVTKQGSVRNPMVLEARPEGIFDQAAKDAAKKFKYKPRVIDGVATEVAGVQNKITFKMN